MALTYNGKEVTIKAVKRYATMAYIDRLDSLRFKLEATNKRAQTKAFNSCNSISDYFNLSDEVFGLTQREPEITGFLEYICMLNPVNVCEIGTLNGGTNFLLSQAVPSVRMMVGVDLLVRNVEKLRHFSRHGQEHHYINGSSYARPTVEKVSGLLQGRKLDVLFIDGDHTFAGVKQDFLCYRHFVRENGIIAFHDVVPDYMTRYGKETTLWAGDVPVFWSKIKGLYPYREFVEDAEQDGYGIGAIIYNESTVPDDLL